MPDTAIHSGTAPRRARGAADKAARRQTILAAAGELFEEAGGELPSVDQVARRAGLAKGTVYLYFRAKEEMFLALLAQELGGWFQALTRIMQDDALVRAGAAAVSKSLVGDLAQRRNMLRLAVQCHGTLERNVAEDAVLAFKQLTAGGLVELGGMVEDRFPGVKSGEGPTLLLQLYALIVGLWQLAEPPKSARAILERPEFSNLKPDFEHALTGGMTAILSGALDN